MLNRNRRIVRTKVVKAVIGIVALCLVSAASSSQGRRRSWGTSGEAPEAEFHMARLIYGGGLGAFSGFFNNNWWAIDYPEAEEHFLPALRRVTNMSVADDSVHLEITDDRIFQYPFLFMQQAGQGNWRPTESEASRMREYLLRGGFLMVDDFHGEYDWAVFESAMRRVLPNRPIIDIPDDDPLLHIFFDLDKRTQIPGRRHLRLGGGGQVVAQMQGAPKWRGIYDDRGRLMVAINFNMDMGDAWEHADDPYYPAEMTGLAYRFGINYVIYAMTH
jgi:hypothetical protein